METPSTELDFMINQFVCEEEYLQLKYDEIHITKVIKVNDVLSYYMAKEEEDDKPYHIFVKYYKKYYGRKTCDISAKEFTLINMAYRINQYKSQKVNTFKIGQKVLMEGVVVSVTPPKKQPELFDMPLQVIFNGDKDWICYHTRDGKRRLIDKSPCLVVDDREQVLNTLLEIMEENKELKKEVEYFRGKYGNK